MDPSNDGTLFYEWHNKYLSSGFKALKCRGYHQKFNPKKDYKTAKKAITRGFTRSCYKSISLNECLHWINLGGWIGWTIPKGMIALDVENQFSILKIKQLYNEAEIRPGEHKTNNGVHLCFKSHPSVAGDTRMFTARVIVKSGV